MSLLDILKGLFRAGGAEEGSSNRVHIIDTTRMVGNNGGRDRLSPRDQFVMLQKLASFIEKEGLRAYAILAGRPLREAADGSEFKGVKVAYAEQPDQLSKMALDLARKHGDALIITQDRDLEIKARSAGVATMRTSTLRKAWDDSGGRQDGGRSGGGRGGRRHPRSRRGGNGGGGERGPRPRNEKPQEKPGEQPAKDGVSDLIDLV